MNPDRLDDGTYSLSGTGSSGISATTVDTDSVESAVRGVRPENRQEFLKTASASYCRLVNRCAHGKVILVRDFATEAANAEAVASGRRRRSGDVVQLLQARGSDLSVAGSVHGTLGATPLRGAREIDGLEDRAVLLHRLNEPEVHIRIIVRYHRAK